MSEANILAATYSDLCSIYRPYSEKLANGETVQHKGLEGRIVATCVPCALSSHSGGKFVQSPSVATAPTEFALFARPEVDIRAGDTVVVTRLGQTRAYHAGEPERHPSHNNIPVVPAKVTT